MTAAKAAVVMAAVLLPLGAGSATAWADDPVPPVTAEQVAALCDLLDDEAVTSRFDVATVERYRQDCAEFETGPDPEVTPPETIDPKPDAGPTAEEPVEPSSESPPPPVPSATDRMLGRLTAPESDPSQPLMEQAADDPGPVASGAFDLPSFDYGDLLVPAASPDFEFESPSAPARPTRSVRAADLIAAGSAIPLATDEDTFPRAAFVAAGVLALTGVGVIRRLAARNH